MLAQPAQKILRSVQDVARGLVRQTTIIDAGLSSRRRRNKVELLFVQLELIMTLAILRTLGPNSAKDAFQLAAPSQNLSQDGQAGPNAGYPSARISRGETISRSSACTGPYAGCEFSNTIRRTPVIPDDLARFRYNDGIPNAIFAERVNSAG